MRIKRKVQECAGLLSSPHTPGSNSNSSTIERGRGGGVERGGTARGRVEEGGIARGGGQLEEERKEEGRGKG